MIKIQRKKPFAFFFHFNKPKSKAAGKPQITLHFLDTCYIVDNLGCEVMTYGRINKRQPFFVMTGKATKIVFGDYSKVAWIS